MLPEGRNETPKLENIFNSDRYKNEIKILRCIKNNAPGGEAGLAATNSLSKILNSSD
jgi:hypothetical protein